MKQTVGNLLLISSIFTTGTFATEGADWYVGVDAVYSQGSTDYDSTKVSDGTTFNDRWDVDSTAFRLKVGMFLGDGGTRVQAVYLQDISNDADVSYITDYEHTEFGLDLIQEFRVTSKFSPFITVGLGLGDIDITGFSQGNTTSYDYYYAKAGLGLSYQFSEHFEVLGGVDYSHRFIKDTTTDGWNEELDEGAVQVYVGLNYLF